MNFGSFADSLKEKAEAAAVAARSFKGFDDMAANDTYIHTDSLNVKRTSSSKAAEQDDHELSASGRSWSLLDRPRGSVTPLSEEVPQRDPSSAQDRQPRPWESPTVDDFGSSSPSVPAETSQPIIQQPPPLRQSTMPLLSVVADALSKHSVHGEEVSNHGLSSSERSHYHDDSDEDEDEDDPILSLIRKDPSAKKGANARPRKEASNMQFLEMEDSSPVRNSNRFMEALDDRMSMPAMDVEVGLAPSDVQETPVSATRPAAWLWGVMSGKQQQATPGAANSKPLAPLSRIRALVSPKPAAAEENFAVVDSTSMLAQDEMRALAQLKLSSRQDPVSALIDKLRRHSREVFIFVTLLVGCLVYFYSRKHSVPDDVN